MNAISPHGLAKVLIYDYFSKNHDAFFQSLAIAGVDGTLDDRFREREVRDLLRLVRTEAAKLEPAIRDAFCWEIVDHLLASVPTGYPADAACFNVASLPKGVTPLFQKFRIELLAAEPRALIAGHDLGQEPGRDLHQPEPRERQVVPVDHVPDRAPRLGQHRDRRRVSGMRRQAREHLDTIT